MGGPDSKEGSVQDGDSSKPKRVRTGCLTCRERHLKCDEGMPNCQNCRKSSRTCRRGIRLNFMYIDCRQPPVLLRSTDNWEVKFEDNSREIANEYKGGLDRYRPYDDSPKRESPVAGSLSYVPEQGQDVQAPHFRPIDQVPAAVYETVQYHPSTVQRQPQHQQTSSQSDSGYSSSRLPMLSASSYTATEPPQTPVKRSRKWITDPHEALFFQVYIEEVAVWMDSLDPQKHFSRILPFQALEMEESMLRDAMLACGAQHMWLVNASYREDTAQHYYHAAVEAMLARLESGHPGQELCAVTSSILNVYCLMCEKPLQRLNDIAAGRALIEKLRWNSKTTGVGNACFWLNVGMDILSRLHFNSTVGGIEKWELNMDFQDQEVNQREEVWTYRIMYLIARICNFRASAVARTQQVSPQREEVWLRQRYDEWSGLRQWVEQWNECIPRWMHPLSYLDPGMSRSQRTWNSSGGRSKFPEVYLLKRITIVARLFYHTAMLLLAQTNPFAGAPGQIEEMHQLQHHHATLICGIVAHTKDRGVASVAIRSLAIAAECITELDQRIEIMQIFDQILKHTGWRLGVVMTAIQKGWGWADGMPPQAKTTTPNEWNSTTAVVDGQHYSLEDGMRMFNELVEQANTDVLPIPPSQQPFRLRPRPTTSHAPMNPHVQERHSQVSTPPQMQHTHPHSSMPPQVRQTYTHSPMPPQQLQPHSQPHVPQVSVPQLHHQQHETSQIRHTQASPQQQLPNQHQHRHSVPTIAPSAVPSDPNFNLSTTTYQNYYIPPNLNQTNHNLQFTNGNLGHLDVSQANMHSMDGYSY